MEQEYELWRMKCTGETFKLKRLGEAWCLIVLANGKQLRHTLAAIEERAERVSNE